MLKRSITLGELITACIVVIGALLSFWINTNVRLTALEISKNNMDNNYAETKATLREIRESLERLNEGQNEIKVTMQNKQDRHQ